MGGVDAEGVEEEFTLEVGDFVVGLGVGSDGGDYGGFEVFVLGEAQVGKLGVAGGEEAYLTGGRHVVERGAENPAVVEVDLGAYAAVEEPDGDGCGGEVGLVVVQDVPGQFSVGGLGLDGGDLAGVGVEDEGGGVVAVVSPDEACRFVSGELAGDGGGLGVGR